MSSNRMFGPLTKYHSRLNHMKLTIRVTNEDGVLEMDWQINSNLTQKIIAEDIVQFAEALTARIISYKWPDNSNGARNETDPETN